MIWLVGAFVTYMALIVMTVVMIRKESGRTVLEDFRKKYPEETEISDVFFYTVMHCIGIILSLVGWPLIWVLLIVKILSKKKENVK